MALKSNTKSEIMGISKSEILTSFISNIGRCERVRFDSNNENYKINLQKDEIIKEIISLKTI